MIFGEGCKLPYRVLGRAPDADNFGKFLMKLHHYNYMVLYKHVLMAHRLARRADDREVPVPPKTNFSILFTLQAINQSNNQMGE